MLTKEQIEAIKEDRCERLEDGEVIDCKFCVHVDYCGINKLADQAALTIDLQAEVDRLKDKLEATETICVGLQTEVDRLKAERRWVPVSEPPNDDRPLLLTDGLDIYSGFYRNGNWHELNGYVLDGITHYKEQMPLPLEGSEK